ncbi:MAG TPA: HTTM domain-containing protein [Kofleriaceae bacterium]|nr:HTTM domain-containing protein [Kofleriaceae bacterium]
MRRQVMAALERVLDREASTRSAALLRIGLALVIVVRFGEQLTFRGDVDPVRLALVAGFWLTTLAMLVGWRSQLASAATAAVIMISAWRFGEVGGQSGWTHHHVYLMLTAVLCVALTPCGRSYSLDRWRAVVAAERAGQPPPPERGLVWAQWLIAVQLTAVYFWGAVDKLNPGWLRGDKFEAQLLSYLFDSDPPAMPGWRAMLVVVSVGTVAVELALAVGLWFRRARRWLIPAGIALHVFIYLTLPVTVFSALSVLLYLAYFDPDEIHRAIDRISGEGERE